MNRISLLTFGCEVGGGVVGNGVRLGKTGGAVGGGCIYCAEMSTTYALEDVISGS